MSSRFPFLLLSWFCLSTTLLAMPPRDPEAASKQRGGQDKRNGQLEEEEDIRAHCIFEHDGDSGSVSGLIELFQDDLGAGVTSLQVIGELALELTGRGGPREGEGCKLMVHEAGRLGRGCGDAGAVLNTGESNGELGTFAAGEVVVLDFHTPRLTLTGPKSIAGRSLVVHAPTKFNGSDAEVALGCCKIVEGEVKLVRRRPKPRMSPSSPSSAASPTLGNGSEGGKKCCHDFAKNNNKENAYRHVTDETTVSAPRKTADPKSTAIPQSAAATTPASSTELRATPVDIEDSSSMRPALKEFRWVEVKPGTFVGERAVEEEKAAKYSTTTLKPVPPSTVEVSNVDVQNLEWIQADDETFVAAVANDDDDKKCNRTDHHEHPHAVTVQLMDGIKSATTTTATTTTTTTPPNYVTKKKTAAPKEPHWASLRVTPDAEPAAPTTAAGSTYRKEGRKEQRHGGGGRQYSQPTTTTTPAKPPPPPPPPAKVHYYGDSCEGGHHHGRLALADAEDDGGEEGRDRAGFDRGENDYDYDYYYY